MAARDTIAAIATHNNLFCHAGNIGPKHRVQPEYRATMNLKHFLQRLAFN